ncbi:MAG: DUF4019 domain-containing protein [Pacificimonas sp.]
MHQKLNSLSEREKDTLRLLVRGYDAKSIAAYFDLSVHTINDRLRAARRKLGVSSSREAARLLAREEAWTPDFSADKEIGMADTGVGVANSGQSDGKAGNRVRLIWLAGGMLIMSLMIAAAILAQLPSMTAASGATTVARSSEMPSTDISKSDSVEAAREWVALIDDGDYEESWRAAGTVFSSQVTSAQWTAAAKAVRDPLGPLVSRQFRSVTAATVLPGMPAGRYEMLEFDADYANQADIVETVVLGHEKDAWRVIGYFARPGAVAP